MMKKLGAADVQAADVRKNGAANVRKIGRQMSQNMGRQMSERQVYQDPHAVFQLMPAISRFISTVEECTEKQNAAV